MGIGPFFTETSNHAENSRKIVTYPPYLRVPPAWAASICSSPFTESFHQDEAPVLTRRAPRRVPTHSRTASTSFVVGRMATHGHMWGRLVFRIEPLPNGCPPGYLCRCTRQQAQRSTTACDDRRCGGNWLRSGRSDQAFAGKEFWRDGMSTSRRMCPQGRAEPEKQYSSAGELIARQPPVRNFAGCGSKLATVLRVLMNGSLAPAGRPEWPCGSIGYLFLSGDQYRVTTVRVFHHLQTLLLQSGRRVLAGNVEGCWRRMSSELGASICRVS
jgi:hypothetical protein